jgi:hypothetical protein
MFLCSHVHTQRRVHSLSLSLSLGLLGCVLLHLDETLPAATFISKASSWANDFNGAVKQSSKQKAEREGQVAIIVDHPVSFDVFGRTLVQLKRCFVSSMMIIRDRMNTNCDDQSVERAYYGMRTSNGKDKDLKRRP